MTTRPNTRVYADAYTTSISPEKDTGEDEDLRLRDGVQFGWLKWRDPWDRDSEVTVESQTLVLTVKGASAGARTLTVRASAETWTDTEINDGNRPGVTGPSCTEAIGTLAEGDTVEIDITDIAEVHAAEDGRNRGIRLATTGSSTHSFYSADSPYPPRVSTTWTEQPTSPTIKPAGGVVASNKPPIGFHDLDIDGDLSALRLQVDVDADEVSPAFDTGAFATTEALLPLADTLYAGLADSAVTQVRGTATVGGVESAWSPWVTIGYRPQRTLVFDSPAGSTVSSTTPVILATYNGSAAGGEELSSYRLQVWDDAGEVLLYDTGRVKATDPHNISEEIPDKWKGRRVLRRKGGDGYQLLLRAWGDNDRVAAPGVPAYAEATALVTVTHDGTLATPTDVTVTPAPFGQPGLLIEWVIAAGAPDEVVIGTADDEVVAKLESGDVNVGGTSYAYLWPGAPPYVEAEVKVAQHDDGKLGPWSATVTGTAEPKGVWVVSESLGVQFHLAGLDVSGWAYTDQGIEYAPSGSPHKVFVTTSQHGMSGRFVGTLASFEEISYEEQLAALMTIKGRPSAEVQIIAGDLTFPARLIQLSPGPHPKFRKGRKARLVAVEFDQRGDLPFMSRL